MGVLFACRPTQGWKCLGFLNDDDDDFSESVGDTAMLLGRITLIRCMQS